MATAKRLEAHLQALNKLFASLVGQPCLDVVAKQQSQSVLRSLANATLTVEDSSKLTTLLNDGAWPPAMKAMLIEEVAKRTSATCVALGGGSRTKLQNYEWVYNYLTTEQWFALSDRQIQDAAKLDIVLDLATHLGLRHPTEATFQMMASLHCLGSMGPDHVRGMAFDRRLQAVQHTKRTFRRKCSHLPQPMHFFDVLPEDPESFREGSAEMFEAVFGKTPPVRCPIPEATLRSTQADFPMRSTKKAVSMAASSGSDMQAMAGMMQNFMTLMGGQRMGGAARPDDVRIEMLNPSRASAPQFALGCAGAMPPPTVELQPLTLAVQPRMLPVRPQEMHLEACNI